MGLFEVGGGLELSGEFVKQFGGLAGLFEVASVPCVGDSAQECIGTDRLGRCLGNCCELVVSITGGDDRSEERRVGKEC